MDYSEKTDSANFANCFPLYYEN